MAKKNESILDLLAESPWWVSVALSGISYLTRLRRKPWPPGRGGMRVSSEALAKEDWSFGGLRRTAGATGSCPWGSTLKYFVPTIEVKQDLSHAFLNGLIKSAPSCEGGQIFEKGDVLKKVTNSLSSSS